MIHLWGPGIMFMIIGTVPYLSERLSGTVKEEVKPIYKYMFKTGLLTVLLYIVGKILGQPYEVILPPLPILLFGVWAIKVLNSMIFEERIEEERKIKLNGQ